MNIRPMNIRRPVVPAIAILHLLYTGAAASAPAAERDAVLWLKGCTGFVVNGNLLVSAKHCRHPETITVPIGQKSVTAHKVYSTPGDDGPVVFRLEGGRMRVCRSRPANQTSATRSIRSAIRGAIGRGSKKRSPAATGGM